MPRGGALTRHNAHNLGPSARKGRRHKDGRLAVETVRKGPRVDPVLAAVLLARGAAAADDDEAHNHEADNRDNLEARDVELDLPKDTDGKEVDDAGDEAEDGDETRHGHLVAPVLDNDAEGGRLDDKDGDPGAPVLPSNGKANGL